MCSPLRRHQAWTLPRNQTVAPQPKPKHCVFFRCTFFPSNILISAIWGQTFCLFFSRKNNKKMQILRIHMFPNCKILILIDIFNLHLDHKMHKMNLYFCVCICFFVCVLCFHFALLPVLRCLWCAVSSTPGHHASKCALPVEGLAVMGQRAPHTSPQAVAAVCGAPQRRCVPPRDIGAAARGGGGAAGVPCAHRCLPATSDRSFVSLQIRFFFFVL